MFRSSGLVPTLDSSTTGNAISKGVSDSLILKTIFGSVGIVGLTALVTAVITIMKKFSLSRKNMYIYII